MNFNRFLLPLGILSGLFTSCMYPYPPNPNTPLVGHPVDATGGPSTVDTAEQQQIREARDAARRQAAEEAANNPPPPGNTGTPSPPPKKEYRTGIPIPGKEGFVFNPFTNTPVDVRAIPPGTLVRDPEDPNPDHKFRVP